MATFEDGSYQSLPGPALIAKVLAGRCKMNYSRAAIGAGTIPEGVSPKELREPPGYVMDATISAVTNPVNGECQVTVQVNSEDVTEGFYATAVIVYADDPDEGQVPYTYLKLEDGPEWIRPASSSVGKLAVFDLIAAVGAVDVVTATIDPDAFVTYGEARQLIDTHDANQNAHAASIAATAALYSHRTILGTAADVERLMPGDTLIITDDSSVEHTTDYQDLLLEAQKAAAGQANTLDDIAVLSAVNATNLRRTADGLLWTTDTVADFRAKLTSFAGAAVAAGYVDADGRCIATWAQAQAWLIAGVLLTPLDAEAQDYFWRKAPPKTEYDAIKERLGAIEAQLLQVAGQANTLINGGNLS